MIFAQAAAVDAQRYDDRRRSGHRALEPGRSGRLASEAREVTESEVAVSPVVVADSDGDDDGIGAMKSSRQMTI